MFRFNITPTENDFEALANHIEQADKESLHPALWQMAGRMAAHLRKLGEKPDEVAHRSVYNALRLLIW